jgi:hypothetical protein
MPDIQNHPELGNPVPQPERKTESRNSGSEKVAGATVGAAIFGGALFGPIGAIVAGAIGGVIGLIVTHGGDENAK